MITLLTGAAGKYIAYAAMAAALAGGAAFMLHEHDVRVLAEQQVAIDKATATEVAKQHAATVAALEQSAAEAQARAATFAQIKAAIHAQPVTKTCVGSPAIGAALDGLRRSAVRGAGTAPADPGKPAKLPR